MIQGYGPVTQALLGTLLTWGLTAAGSAMVIFLRGNQVIDRSRKLNFLSTSSLHQTLELSSNVQYIVDIVHYKTLCCSYDN